MNKKVIADIQTRIDAAKLKIESLEKMLDDSVIPEPLNNALALQQQKHDLMIDSPDDAAAIEELSNRLAIAIEADRLAAEAANDAAGLRGSIKNRIAVEQTAITNLTSDHKSAIAGMLQIDADKKAADRDAAMVIYKQKAFEIAAIEETQRNVLNLREPITASANQEITGKLWGESGGIFGGDIVGKAVAAEVAIIKTNLIKAGITL